MSSWVRYSVAVYLGLLISGALAQQPRYVPSAEPAVAPSVRHEVPPPTNRSPVAPEAAAKMDVSV